MNSYSNYTLIRASEMLKNDKHQASSRLLSDVIKSDFVKILSSYMELSLDDSLLTVEIFEDNTVKVSFTAFGNRIKDIN